MRQFNTVRNTGTEDRPALLVVDDDEILRTSILLGLTPEMYRVGEAEDGASALEALRQDHYDLVLLDISTPDMDGYEVCRRIHAEFEEPPLVLMLTALDDEDAAELAYKAGAIDFFRKPINWPIFRTRLRYLLAADRSRRELEILNRNYAMILDSAADGICALDGNFNITLINPAALRMLGYNEEEVLGRCYQHVFKAVLSHSALGEAPCCPLPGTFCDEENGVRRGSFRFSRKNGATFPVDCRATPIRKKDKIIGGVILFQDVTEQRMATEVIEHMANHDHLTDLPNRNYFMKRLPQAVALAERQDRLLVLLFIDLDRFKPINDHHGHHVGDTVLVRVSERLKALLRSADGVCRLGGDEFVVLLESTDDLEGAKEVARKTIEVLNQPMMIGEVTCSVGASIGISVYPLDCEDADTMLRHADIAMYQAKELGRNRFSVFTGPARSWPAGLN